MQQFIFRHFERTLVVLLVASLLGINSLVEQKFAFLSFYYLPIILAGFYGGRRFAVVAGLFIASLVFFFQATQGLGMDAGLTQDALMLLIPWSGFLILTGYVVGGLAEQRAARLADLKNAYLATLEVLTADQRLLRLLSRSVTDETLAVARALRGAAQIIAEYSHYYEIVGDDWDIEALPMAVTVKVLAVADAFETLQMATPVRPAFTRWSALEEVEKGAGKTFAREAVRGLRIIAGRPEKELRAG